MTLNNVAKMNLRYIVIVVAMIMMLPLVYRLLEAYEDGKKPKSKKAQLKKEIKEAKAEAKVQRKLSPRRQRKRPKGPGTKQ